MKPLGSRDMFVRGDGPGAAAAPAGPEPAARRPGATSLQSGLFLPSELFIPTDPCLPPSLI